MEAVPADRALTVLLLLVSTALVGAAALLAAARFGDGSLAQLVIGATTIAFGEIVLVSLLLSPGDDLTRPALLAALGVLFAVSLTTVRSGLRVPALRPAGRALLRATHDPVVAIAAVAAASVVAYSLALALFTPPNDQDALEYHLARAAFWTQQHSISYIAGSDDARLSSFPPNGEIAMAFTMISSGSSRYAPLVQLFAALAAAAAIYGIARRIGLSIRPALYGALVFLTLPVVALQTSTGLNDIVVAWLVASAVFFLLRSSPFDLVLAGIATALLVGTKLTGPLVLPALGAIALVATRRRRVVPLAVLALATVVGAYWYVVNIVETGEAVGGFEGGVGSNVRSAGRTDVLVPIGRVVRLALASLELPGAVGFDRLLYVAAAAALVLALLLGRGMRSDRGKWAALAAAATLAPLVLVPFGQLLVRANEKLYFELGRQDAGYLDPDRSTTRASPIFSWYGPASVVLVLVSLPLLVRLVRRKRLPPVALLLGAGPLIWVVLVGIFVPYTEWNGRYVMGGVALASATWGVTLRIRPLALGAATIALVTAVLIMVHNHDKPAGVRLLEPSDVRSVWTQPDWMVQAREAGHLGPVFRFFDERVPGDQRVAITQRSRGRYVMPFPFFGEDLSRSVVFASTPKAAREAGADWVVLRTEAVRSCAPGWRAVWRYTDLVVLRRAPGVVCRQGPP